VARRSIADEAKKIAASKSRERPENEDERRKTETHRPRAEANGHAELLVRRLSDLTAKPVRYIVPGRIARGKLHLIGGRGGSGKSTLLRALVAALSRGLPAFGLKYTPVAPIKILLVAAEDGAEDTIVPGLAAEGADLSRVEIIEGVLCGNSKSGFTLNPADVDLVRARLKECPDIALIIIDPVASYVGRSRVDDNRAGELRAAILDPLSQLAEDTGVAVLIVAHLNKGCGEAVDRIAGSAAYRDAVRCAYLVAPSEDDGDKRVLAPIKENLPGIERTSIPFRLRTLTDTESSTVLAGPQFMDLDSNDRSLLRGQLRRIEFEPPEQVDPDSLFRPKGEKDKNKVQKCADWLADFLRRFAYPSAEIVEAAKRAGFTFDNVQKAKTLAKARLGLRNSNLVS
jgi:energy-coupling factor transporter ATP-binding protein EcfA2